MHSLCFLYLTHLLWLHYLTDLLWLRLYYWYYAFNIYFHAYEVLLKPWLPLWRIHIWFEIWQAHQVFTILLSEKKPINDMSEINIPIHAMIYCCGWETQILHTTFSYVFSYMSNGMRCGNTLARWYFNMSSDIYSCVPPTIYYIQTESEKVQFFVNVFFFTKQGSRAVKNWSIFLLHLSWNPMMRLLVSSKMNHLVSTRILVINTFTIKPFTSFQKFIFLIKPLRNIRKR